MIYCSFFHVQYCYRINLYGFSKYLSNFIGIANKIVEQEIKNGDFDLLLGQMYLTDIELGRTRAGNTKLYILHESNTENYFIFGIKNLFQNSGL